MSQKRLKYNTQSFIERAQKIHGNKYNYKKSIYVTSNDKIIVTCPKHGDFQIVVSEHWRGKECPKCGIEKRSLSQSLTKEEFLRRAREKFGWKYEYDLSTYKNRYSLIKIKCPEHGEFWQKPRYHLEGLGCPKCGRLHANKSNSDSLEDFLEKAKKSHPTGYLFNKVKLEDFNDKVTITCKKHGDFKMKRSLFVFGQNCPKCTLINQMKLLQKLETRFPNLTFQWEYKADWLGRQRIDIFISELKVAIEYDGIQHFVPLEFFGGKIEFEKRKKSDELKEQKCLKNGVKLFRLKYNYKEEDFENLCNIIKTKYGEDKNKNKQ